MDWNDFISEFSDTETDDDTMATDDFSPKFSEIEPIYTFFDDFDDRETLENLEPDEIPDY